MGNVNQLTLDRNGQITELVSAVVYAPFGPLKALNLGNGLARSIDHDQAYHITAINDPVYDVAFNYDANGNIIYQSRNVGDLDTNFTQQSGYGLAGRNGATLSKKWANGLSTFHGLYSHDFPNVFTMGLTQTGFTTSIPHALNEQAKHL